MRNRLIAVVCAVLAALASGWADTIHFKNGIYIEVDSTTEIGDQIEYRVGSTKYTIPKAQVERIEKTGGPGIGLGTQTPTNIVPSFTADAGLTISAHTSSSAAPESAHSKIAVPAPSTPQDEAYWNGLRAQVLNGDRVDESALAAIEKQGNSKQTANAYFAAGLFELQHHDLDSAVNHFQQAVNSAPGAGWLLAWYAIGLEEDGRLPDAASQAERLTELQPRSAAAFRLLGVLQYNTDRTADAVRDWQRAQELEPDTFTGERLQRAQHELDIEERFNQKESRHFSLRYEGAQTPLALERDLLGTMESQFEELSRALEYTPPENIVVILYTEKEFFDITEAPSWAGALNDGKLRIPLRGISAMTPALQHVLKHELTHSFIRSMVRDRCPAWLNEGLAQMLEPRSSSPYAPFLAHMFQQRKQLPLNLLERPFTGFSPMQAEVAYAESLATVQYLRQRYGMDDVLRILHRIGSGETAEAALREVTQSDYAELEQHVGEYLAKNGPQ